jgi:hypothetical protein
MLSYITLNYAIHCMFVHTPLQVCTQCIISRTARAYEYTVCLRQSQFAISECYRGCRENSAKRHCRTVCLVLCHNTQVARPCDMLLQQETATTTTVDTDNSNNSSTSATSTPQLQVRTL